MSILDELIDLQHANRRRCEARSEADRVKRAKPRILSLSIDDAAALREFAQDHSAEVEAVIAGDGELPSEQDRESILAARDAVQAQDQVISEQRSNVEKASAALNHAKDKASGAASLAQSALELEEGKLSQLQEERDRLIAERDQKVEEKEQDRRAVQDEIDGLSEAYRQKDKPLLAQLRELESERPSRPDADQASRGCSVVVRGTIITVAVASLGMAFSGQITNLFMGMDALTFVILLLLVSPIIGYSSACRNAKSRSKRELQAQMSAYEEASREWQKKRESITSQQARLREEQMQEQAELVQRQERYGSEIKAVQAECESGVAALDDRIQAQEKVCAVKRTEAEAVSLDEVCAAEISALKAEEANLEALVNEQAQLQESYYLSLGPILAQVQEEAGKPYRQACHEAEKVYRDRQADFEKARNISGMAAPFPEGELGNLDAIIQKIESGRASSVSEAFNLLDQERQERKQQEETQKRIDALEAQHQADLQEREAELQRLQEEHERELDELEADREAALWEATERAYLRCDRCAHLDERLYLGTFADTFCDIAGLYRIDSLECNRYRPKRD